MNNERIARGSVLSIVAELDKRDAEIERLREENSTFSDSLAAKADRIDRLGETVARQVAEIERLRGLLEDACRWHEQFPIQRVRELLGER